MNEIKKEELLEIINDIENDPDIEICLEPRYELVEGSESGHCCFEASIIDKDKPILRGDGTEVEGQFDIVLECFEVAEAEKILKLLNA